MKTVTIVLSFVACVALCGPPSLVGLARGLERGADAVVLLNGAQSAEIEITQSTGNFWLAGGTMATGTLVGSTELLRGRFEPVESLPNFTYRVNEGNSAGMLSVTPELGAADWAWSDSDADWRFFLNPMVALDLDLEVGTGRTELALGGLLVTSVALDAGAGDVMLDLSGDWRQDMTADVDLGAGDLTILVPRNVGTRITLDQGSGDVTADSFVGSSAEMVNAAYGGGGPVIDLRIKVGAGDVTLVER